MIKEIFCNLTKEDIKDYIQKHGSVYMHEKDGYTCVELVYPFEVNSVEFMSGIEVIDYCFKNIDNRYFYFSFEYLGNSNLPYWLALNADGLNDNEKWELADADKYCKNNFNFYKANGEISSTRSYLKPVCSNYFEGGYKEEIIVSKNLGEEFRYVVIRSNLFDENKPKNCIFISDGQPWLYTMHLNKAIDELNMENLIQVYIMQNDRNKELPFNVEFSRFVTKELKPLIARKYNIPFNPGNFMFFGNSYGGLAGLNICLFTPNEIGTIISQSPSLQADIELNNSKISKRMLEKSFAEKVYISYGINETKDLINAVENLKSKITDSNVIISKYLGGHDYQAWLSDFKTIAVKLKEKNELI